MTNSEISLVKVGDNSDQNSGIDREKLNVNSPKSGPVSDNMFATPASLITQVKQDDIERQKEMAKVMGKRANDQKEGEQENVPSEQTPIPENSGRGFSSWLCCGPCARKDRQYIVKSNEDSSEQDDDNKVIVSSDNTTEWAVEAKIMENGDEVNDDVDPEEEFAIEISETEENNWLLHPIHPSDKGRKCLVLDLDETLVHSNFQPSDCSFSLPIELDGVEYQVYVLKRPFVDEFITECAKLYELVVFTASLSEYANPVIDTLDKKGLIKHRLFRESCVFHENQVYVKDLSRLGRNIKDCIIIDNSPFSYLFDPTNAIGCTSWFGDEQDTELRDLLPVLNGPLLKANDVRTILDAQTQSIDWLIDQYGDKNVEREHSITE